MPFCSIISGYYLIDLKTCHVKITQIFIAIILILKMLRYSFSIVLCSLIIAYHFRIKLIGIPQYANNKGYGFFEKQKKISLKGGLMLMRTGL